MKIKINKNILLTSLKIILKALNSNSPFSALRGIYINVKANLIELTASDGDLSIKTTIDIDQDLEINEIGKILVPGRIFFNVINKQNDEILISKENNLLIISSKDYKTSISLLKHEEYPILDFSVTDKVLEIETEKLKKIIQNVIYATSDNGMKMILNGVNLIAKNNKLVAYATDSFRIAKDECEINFNDEFNLIILSKNIKDFLPQDSIDKIKISIGETKIISQHKNTIVSSKLIDGVYPDIKNLLPKKFKTTVKIQSNELNNLLEKVTAVSNEENKIIKISVSGEKFKIKSKKEGIADSSVVSNNYSFEGEELSIVLNASFLKDAISKFDGEIEIKFNDKYEPFLVRGESNKSLINLILPHRSY